MTQELSRKELLDKIEKEAYDYEYNIHGCSRSTLLALQNNLNLGGGDKLALAAGPLSGGMGMMGEACGALTGSLMAIGLAMGLRGGQDPNDREGFYRSLAAGKLFYQRFLEQEGSVLCRHLQARALGRYYPIMEPFGYKGVVEKNVYIKCATLVGRVARLATEFILEQREKDWADAQAENVYPYVFPQAH